MTLVMQMSTFQVSIVDNLRGQNMLLTSNLLRFGDGVVRCGSVVESSTTPTPSSVVWRCGVVGDYSPTTHNATDATFHNKGDR